MIPGGQGQIELPTSNELAELHRIIRNQDARFRALENKTQGGSAPTLLTRPSSASGFSLMRASGGESATPPPAVPSAVTVSFIKLRTLLVDPADGELTVDADGYGVMAEISIPVPVQPMQAVTVTLLTAGGAQTWDRPTDFDDVASFVNVVGELSWAMRLDVALTFGRVVFRNGTTGTGTLNIAMLNVPPNDQDIGINLPQGGVVWLQSNTEGTALEVVQSYE